QVSHQKTPQQANQNEDTPQSSANCESLSHATKENAGKGACVAAAEASQVTSPLAALVPAAVNGDNIGSPKSPAATTASILGSSAIKNAAKKAMTRVEQLRRSGSVFSPRTKGSSPLQSRHSSPSITDNGNEAASIQYVSQESQSKSLSEQDSPSRAISTPTGKLSNITFGADGNVTMLPPSPIPSMATAIARGGLCISPTVRVEMRGDRTILHMPHPDLEEPKSQMWNVQSPAVKATKESIKESKSSTPSRKSHAASRVGLKTHRSRR
ncbi:hypothetical protein EGW08_015632, partial [Elysia chlorotica]